MRPGDPIRGGVPRWLRLSATMLVVSLLMAALGVPAGAQTPQPVQSPAPTAPGGPATTFYPQPGGLSAGPGPLDRRGVSLVVFSPDGMTLAVGTAFGIGLFSLTSPENVQYTASILSGTAVTALSYAPNGGLLASGTFTGTVQLWDAQTGDPRGSLQAPQGAVNGLAFSPEGDEVAAAGSDGVVRIWRTTDGRLLQTLRGHLGAVLSVAFSPDGRSLVSGGADGKVQEWAVTNGLSVASLVGNVGGAPAVAFDPSGSLIGLGSGDGVVRIWDLAAGKLSQTLTGHHGQITDVAFSPDDSTLASASYDGNVMLWRVADGKLVRTLQGTSALRSLAFGPSGDLLATGALDGAVQLWTVGGAPAPAGTPVVMATPVPVAPPCVDNVAYVADVTLPDNSSVAPGSLLRKTWRVRNTGTCAWGAGYQFAFAGGAQMNAAPVVALPAASPGATVDITVLMYAPVTPGPYQGIWQFLNAAGQPFGVRLTIRVIVPTPPTPTPTFGMNITTSATDINAGDTVTIRASVEGVSAAWVNGQPVINNFREDTVRLCGDQTFTLDALLTNGQHQYQSVTVHVHGVCQQKADLVMKSLSADHTTVHLGQTVHFSARVKNEGDKDAKNFAVAWDPGNGAGWIIEASEVDLDQGDDHTFTWTYIFPATGTYHSRVKADYYDDVDEKDEDNNEKGLTIKVQP